MFKNKKQKVLFSIISSLVITFLVVLPIVGVCVYEANFGTRYQTSSQYEYTVSDFDGLLMERSDFVSDKTKLAGYKYSNTNKDGTQNIKGLVVTAHGLGGGGHNAYLPFINYFTSRGYYVFTYDAKGNDNSEGKTVGGLPRGIIDLYNAIEYAKTIPEYKDLPIMLFGHSWGGYSVANVLNFVPDVKAAVVGSGFNKSKDLLLYQGRQMASIGADLLLPYFLLYEKVKFGIKFTSCSGVIGLQNTNANIMIVHSKDDDIVPLTCGYETFYKKIGTTPRITFVLFDDRGHNNVFFEKGTVVRYGKQERLAFDESLMQQIISMFDESC